MVAATELREAFDALGLTQGRVAQLFDTSPRNVRRWRGGTRRTPVGVDIVLHLLAAGVVTVDQIERAAARTNGDARPEPPAPLPGKPAPELPVLAPAEPALLADPGLNTAEKIAALEPGTCRWPHGDPAQPDFFFCGRPAAGESYCAEHRSRA